MHCRLFFSPLKIVANKYNRNPYNHPALRDIKEDQSTTFVALLRACGKNKDLSQGTKLHNDILSRGLLERCSDALVTMYAKCGALGAAKTLFDMHKSLDLLTWTALIGGYAHKGEGQNALHYFEQMQREGLFPDAVTYCCILKACGSIGAAKRGERIHGEIAKQGLLENNIVLGNALVDMYVKCGALKKAREVLQELVGRDVITWNALIGGYAKHGQGKEALQSFEQMQHEGICPDVVTFISILKACGNEGAVDRGEEIHKEISKQGLLRENIVLGTTLVDMYAKCGALLKARWVLEELSARNVISWTALIAGYAEHDKGEEALECFERMQFEGISPDAATFICVLKACGSIRAIDKGREVHDLVATKGLLKRNVGLGNAIIDMYAKCGDPARAQQVLQGLPVRNTISWTALIVGYAENGDNEKAFDCFERMQQEGVCPNEVTFVCILKVCGSIGAADKGERVHDEISKQGYLGKDPVVGNALVDMYAKCGGLEKARQVLQELPKQEVITWNGLISGYVEHGKGEQALNCFKQMQRNGLSPDMVTFVCILKACGSIGAIDKGEEIHDNIAQQGLLGKCVQIGNALVDMYAKCGALAKARRVLTELHLRNVISWTSLIAGHVQQGEGAEALQCFKKMKCEGLTPNATTYACVLSACGRLGQLEDAQTHFVEMTMKYGIKPDLEHCNYMVDLFGRAGHLARAMSMIEKMASCGREVWTSLLSACLKWGDVEVGRWAFERAIQLHPRDGAFYNLMAKIYASAGMQEDMEYVETLRIENRAWKKSDDSLLIDLRGEAPS